MIKPFVISFCIICISATSLAEPKKQEVKPSAKKKVVGPMVFNSRLVEGKVYRPELSVVTGDTKLEGFGVLRLRPDFMDHLRADAGEKIR